MQRIDAGIGFGQIGKFYLGFNIGLPAVYFKAGRGNRINGHQIGIGSGLDVNTIGVA